MERRSFKTYQILSNALSRNEIKRPGVTATVLLECFIHNHGELKAAAIEGKNLCEAGKFKIWRENLIKKGWVTYSIGEYSRHYPGAKMIKYINKEKLSNEEIATTRELRKVEQKLEEKNKGLEDRVSVLEEVVKNMIEEFDPPVTDEKIQRRLKVVNEK